MTQYKDLPWRRTPEIAGVAMLVASGGLAARADRAAEAALDRCMWAEARLTSLRANYLRETHAGGKVTVLWGDVSLRRPNGALVRIQAAAREDVVTYRSDALNFVTYYAARNEYYSQVSDREGKNVQAAGCMEAAVFFDPQILKTYRSQGNAVTIGPAVTVGGERCTQLVIPGASPGAAFRLYVGRDALLRGVKSELGGGLSIESQITAVRANAQISASIFAWRPPQGARPALGSVCRFSLSATPLDPALTRVGQAAPNFPISAAGPEVKGLLGLLRQHTAVVLTFWGFG